MIAQETGHGLKDLHELRLKIFFQPLAAKVANQPLAAKVAIVAKPRKHVSPRTMNALMVGITRCSSEFRRTSDSDASVDRELDGEDADAQTSFNGSLHDDLFGNNVSRRPWSPEMQGTQKVMRQGIITTTTSCPAWSHTVMMVLRTTTSKSMCALNQKMK